ncbi:MAG: rhodanese-like domain-containing protein [Planctomycetota bacterium]
MSGDLPALDERGLPEGYPFKEEYEITPRDAAARLVSEDASFLLIDVREDDELQTARVAGAIQIRMSQIEERFDEIAEYVEDHPDGTIAFLCHHGVRSLKVTLAARAMGAPNSVSVAGGIDAWSMGVDPSIPLY